MHWKLLTLIAALLLVVTTSAPPTTVEAQEELTPTDNIRRALAVGVGTNQSLNLYINVHSDRLPAPLPPDLKPSLVVTIQPGGVLPDGAPCSQTIQAQVNLNPGLNVLALGIASEEDGKMLLLNGDPQDPPLDDCFDEAKRAVMILGDLNAYAQEDPITSTSPRKNRSLLMYDVTDPNGATAASGPAGVFTISATFRNNVVGLGLGEGVEFYYGGKPGQGNSEGSGGIGDTVVFTYVVTNTGDATCTQTIEKSVLATTLFGLPIPATTLSKGFGFVTFDDGDLVELEDPCFKEDQSQRVAIQVDIAGGDRGFKLSDNNSPFPTTVPARFPHLQALGYSIYDSQTGATRAEQWQGARVISSQKAGVPLP